MKTLEILNKEFGIPEVVKFIKGTGNLDTVEIKNKFAQASIVLMGANVLTFQPVSSVPVFWHSSKSNFIPGKPIRGGIPICFPWFGLHPTDNKKPLHGFARLKNWDVETVKIIQDNKIQLALSLKNDEETLSIWPFPFECLLTVTLGKNLDVSLTIKNTGSETITLTSALHTYFNIGDINKITITGLENTEYIDRTDNFTKKIQKGPIAINSETVRGYYNTTADCIIKDPVFNRAIRIKKRGSDSTFVWNPWIEKCALNEDMANDDYLKMVCVETTKAGDDSIKLEAGDKYEFAAIISVEKLN